MALATVDPFSIASAKEEAPFSLQPFFQYYHA
jgi:hypothetical protein